MYSEQYIDHYMDVQQAIAYRSGCIVNRLEDYSPVRRLEYIKNECTDRPTIVSVAFGDAKLIRTLDYPFHMYSITHDGLVYSNRAMVFRGTTPCMEAMVPSYTVSSGAREAEYEMVRLRDSYGMLKSFLIHRLVAYMYIPNPKNYQVIEHLNTYTLDNHVQNLAYVFS